LVREPSTLLPKLERWTDVPDGQKEVNAKVGDVLHLPIIRAESIGNMAQEVWLVSVNGVALEPASYFTEAKQTSIVFKAEKPGEYKVEVCARGAIPPRDILWNWNITISK
jgi:hypothetical protein